MRRAGESAKSTDGSATPGPISAPCKPSIPGAAPRSTRRGYRKGMAASSTATAGATKATSTRYVASSAELTSSGTCSRFLTPAQRGVEAARTAPQGALGLVHTWGMLHARRDRTRRSWPPAGRSSRPSRPSASVAPSRTRTTAGPRWAATSSGNGARCSAFSTQAASSPSTTTPIRERSGGFSGDGSLKAPASRRAATSSPACSLPPRPAASRSASSPLYSPSHWTRTCTGRPRRLCSVNRYSLVKRIRTLLESTWCIHLPLGRR